MVEQSRWYIDPDSLQLAGVPSSIMTDDEWREQAWPSCPTCGGPIEVDRIEITTAECPSPYRCPTGMWECPRGCDPRRGDPRRVKS